MNSNAKHVMLVGQLDPQQQPAFHGYQPRQDYADRQPGVLRRAGRRRMTRARSAVPSALLAVVLVGGCGGTTTTVTPSAPAVHAPTATAPAPGAGAGATSTPTPGAASDAAPIDATCPSSNATAFAKTKFVAHAGLAFGAFHRYLYKPYQAGAFASGRSGRVVALAKAGASALFIKREIRLASEDVKANPALCNAVAAPLASVGNSISGAVSRLKTGDASGLTAAQTAVTGIESTAGASGNTITEDPNPPIG